MQVYVCLDLTDVAYVDSAGVDQSSEGHREYSPIEVVFQNDLAAPSTLIIE